LERLEKAAHQLFRGKPLELGELFGREVREVLRVAQPLEDLGRDLLAERTLYAAEHAPEHAIIRVEVGLALHQNRATEMIEAEQARSVKILFDGAQQGLPFLDRNRHALGAQPIEEIEEHGRMPPLQA